MTAFELGGSAYTPCNANASMYQFYPNGMLVLSDEGEELLQYLPATWHGGANVRILQEVVGQEFERALKAYEDVQAQCYIDTATWGLSLWEVMLALPAKTDISPSALVVRRTAVKLALARDEHTSEKYFQQGIAAIAGITDEAVIITPLSRRTARYTWRVEVPVTYYARAPASAPTLTEVLHDAGGTAATWRYAVSYLYREGETAPGPESSLAIQGVPGTVYVALSDLPIGPTDVLGRRIYRSVNAGAWVSRGIVLDNVSTTFNDNGTEPTYPMDDGGAPLTEGTAKTAVASAIEEFIRVTKPAHLRVTSQGVGFRADFSVAGDEFILGDAV